MMLIRTGYSVQIITANKALSRQQHGTCGQLWGLGGCVGKLKRKKKDHSILYTYIYKIIYA